MDRGTIMQFLRDRAINRVISAEMSSCGRRLEMLVEQMQNNENPEINPQRMEEMLDMAATIRVYAEKIS